MDFLGIGPLEILFVLLIVLIVFGPKDIIKAGRTMGRFLRNLVLSPGWQAFQKTSRDLRNLPNKLMREAGLEEFERLSAISPQTGLKNDIQKQITQVEEGLSTWTTQPTIINTPAEPLPPAPITPAQPEDN